MNSPRSVGSAVSCGDDSTSPSRTRPGATLSDWSAQLLDHGIGGVDDLGDLRHECPDRSLHGVEQTVDPLGNAMQLLHGLVEVLDSRQEVGNPTLKLADRLGDRIHRPTEQTEKVANPWGVVLRHVRTVAPPDPRTLRYGWVARTSSGSQLHIRLRSPYAASIRDTGGSTSMFRRPTTG